MGINITVTPEIIRTDAVILREHRYEPYDDACIFDGNFEADAGITRLHKADLDNFATFFDHMILRDFRHRYQKDIKDFEKVMELHDPEPVSRLCGLVDQLHILLCALDYEERLEKAGFTTCTPTFNGAKNTFDALALYSIGLVSGGVEQVVCNDVELADQFYILTGANHSGKTELLIAISQAQFLAQLGLNAPCSKLYVSVVPAIHTLFSGGEDSDGKLSRMGVEAARFADIMADFQPGSLVFFNEPMTSTNPTEGAQICADMISKSLEAGGHGIVVTHLYELLSLVGDRCGSLVMEVEQDLDSVRRTFKVHSRLPYCQSYALELAQQAGLCDRRDTQRMAFLQELAEQVGIVS